MKIVIVFYGETTRRHGNTVQQGSSSLKWHDPQGVPCRLSEFQVQPTNFLGVIRENTPQVPIGGATPVDDFDPADVFRASPLAIA